MTIRILIVDDHMLVRQALVRLLSAYACFEVVGTACDGAQAVSQAADLTPDVVLLDIALTDMSGLDVIEPILKQSPATRILMLSMYAESEYARTAVIRGAAGLISKSADPDCLGNAIRSVARGDSVPIESELSAREREVLELIAAGKTNQQICNQLSIHMKTVHGHCERMMSKLDIHTRAGLVAYGQRLGF